MYPESASSSPIALRYLTFRPFDNAHFNVAYACPGADCDQIAGHVLNFAGVAELASQTIGILQQLGRSAPDEDAGDNQDDDEIEAKAAALRLRIKMLP